MTHPTGYGAQILGNWVYQALMQGYNDYQQRMKAGARDADEAGTQREAEGVDPGDPTP